MKPLHSLPVLLFCTLLALPAGAAPWYRVELMLVAYENIDDIDQELWSDALPDAQADEEKTALPDYRWWQAPQMYQQAYSALWAGFSFSSVPRADLPVPFVPLEHLLLTDAEQRINKRDDMHVVWHQAWIEPIQEEDHAIVHPLHIDFKNRFDIRINGSFELHRSRYLHIDTDLTVQHYALQEPAALDALVLPGSDTRSDYRNDILSQENISASLAAPMPAPLRAAEVKQSRRMRSGELHYIDHPMLGIVLKIIPVESAEDL